VHLLIVESQNEIPERDKHFIAPKVSAPVLRLRVMCLAVTLDQEAVTDKQISSSMIADGQRSLWS